jgi:hypothetical protein
MVKTDMRSRQERAGLALTIAALGFIAAETLVPHPERVALVAETPIWCLVCGELGVVDVLLNIALFVPLGAGLALLEMPKRRVLLIGAALSLSIELAQYFFIVGRDASLSDLLTNSTGSVVGAALTGSWRSWVMPGARRARALAAIAALGWLLQVAISGAVVQPSLPTTIYWGQRAADLAQFDTFPGRLLDAKVGNTSMPSHRLANSTAVRRQLLGGEPLSAVAIPAEPTQGLAPLASIFDDRQQEIAVLGQWKEDLVFRLRTRAVALELRQPAVRLDGVFRNASGDTVTVAGAVQEGRFVISSQQGGSRASRTLPLSAQWGWSLLLPFDYAFGPEVSWLSALWIGCWLLPVGFWLSGAEVGAVAVVAVTLLVLFGGVLLIPALLHEPWAPSEWFAGLSGALAGWAVARVARAKWSQPPGAGTP